MRRPSAWSALTRSGAFLAFVATLAASVVGLGVGAASAASPRPRAPPPRRPSSVWTTTRTGTRSAYPPGRWKGSAPDTPGRWLVNRSRPSGSASVPRRTSSPGGSTRRSVVLWAPRRLPGGRWRSRAVTAMPAAGATVQSSAATARTTEPERGSVAWWGPGLGAGGGMVAIVTGVNIDGSVDVEEYNLHGTGRHGFRAGVRADAYLHIADQPGPLSRFPQPEPPAELPVSPSPTPRPEPVPEPPDGRTRAGTSAASRAACGTARAATGPERRQPRDAQPLRSVGLTLIRRTDVRRRLLA